jgi:cytochrome c biogenesis factor
VVKGEHHHTVTPILLMGPDGRKTKRAIIHEKSAYGPEVSVTINNLNADTKMVELLFSGIGEEDSIDHDHAEQLVIEFSQKPFMSILWLGTILLLAGTLISFTQRIKSFSS